MIYLIDATPVTEYYAIRYSPDDEWEGCGFPQPPDNADLLGDPFDPILDLLSGIAMVSQLTLLLREGELPKLIEQTASDFARAVQSITER